MEHPRLATPHENDSMDDVSCLPVSRRSFPSPYCAMCTACRFSSLAIWAWIASHPVPAARVALEEKLVCPPAPFQSPGMGLGSRVRSTL